MDDIKCKNVVAFNTIIVLILIPVLENASDKTENANIKISECSSLCTGPIPCDLLVAKLYPVSLVSIDCTSDQFFFAALKQYGSCAVLPLSFNIFKSSDEERTKSAEHDKMSTFDQILHQ